MSKSHYRSGGAYEGNKDSENHVCRNPFTGSTSAVLRLGGCPNPNRGSDRRAQRRHHDGQDPGWYQRGRPAFGQHAGGRSRRRPQNAQEDDGNDCVDPRPASSGKRLDQRPEPVSGGFRQVQGLRPQNGSGHAGKHGADKGGGSGAGGATCPGTGPAQATTSGAYGGAAEAGG